LLFFFWVKAKATAKTNTGVLRFAQNDDVKTNNGNDNSRGKGWWVESIHPTLRAIKPTRRMGHPLLLGWSGENNSKRQQQIPTG